MAAYHVGGYFDGYGSGRPRQRPYLGQLHSFDVRNVADSPGGTITWSTGSSIGVDRRGDTLRLSFSINGNPVGQWIDLYRQPCRFGGNRPWFRCPECQQICQKLYLIRGRFQCRTCTGCPYYTQTASKEDRLTYRLRKIQQRLLPKGEDANDYETLHVPRRPAWMRHRTYKRLRERCIDVAFAREQVFEANFEAFVMPRLARLTGTPLENIKKAFG